MKIKLMSFNIQHARNYNYPDEDRIDFKVMADAIASQGADIIGLNEVRGEGEDTAGYADQAKAIASILGYYYFFAPAINIERHGPYGNALISRFPITNAEIIPIPDPEDRIPGHGFETRCILKATVRAAKPLTVFVTHFGLNPSEADNAASAVAQALSDTNNPKVLLGDFNLLPESPILDRIRIVMADAADAFDSSKYSYPSDNPQRNLDYIFVSDDIEVIEADIPAVVASDHRPHTALIEI